jgi:hypothetical protein
MTIRMLLILLAVSAATATSHGSMNKGGLGGSTFLAPFTVGLKWAMNDRHGQTQSTIQRENAVSPIPIPDTCNFLDTTCNTRGGARTMTASTCSGKPPARFLKWAYSACGVAATAAWSTVVYTTIRSNQPPGAMMPCWQHRK